MSDNAKQGKSLSPTLVLTIAGLLATLLVAGTHLITGPAIAQQEQRQLLRIFREILPQDVLQHSNNDGLNLNCHWYQNELLANKPQKIYFSNMANQSQVSIYNAIAADGYNGDIKLVVAVSEQGKVLGTRVLMHNETPGLGDKIERRKSKWIDAFVNSSLDNKRWDVKKQGGDFDAFTGATITPRAVIKAVQKVLQVHRQDRQKIINNTKQCEF